MARVKKAAGSPRRRVLAVRKIAGVGKTHDARKEFTTPLSAMKWAAYRPTKRKKGPPLRRTEDEIAAHLAQGRAQMEARARAHEAAMSRVKAAPRALATAVQADRPLIRDYLATRYAQLEKPFLYGPFGECRFRKISILECLRDVCTELEDPVPVQSWDGYLGGDVDVTWDTYATVEFSDDVGEVTGYSSSSGTFTLYAGMEFTQEATLKEVGIRFDGYGSYQTTGDRDSGLNPFDDWGWGNIDAKSIFSVRSQPDGGTETQLVPASQRERTEINDYNDYNIVSPTPWTPSNRSRSVDIPVLPEHEIMIDWTFDYDISAAGYYGYAGLGFRAAAMPYVIYETCHKEWRRVRGPLMALAAIRDE